MASIDQQSVSSMLETRDMAGQVILAGRVIKRSMLVPSFSTASASGAGGLVKPSSYRLNDAD